jgi:hypothetical protein
MRRKTPEKEKKDLRSNNEELNTERPTIVIIFGSHETSPIIWIGKPAPAIQC